MKDGFFSLGLHIFRCWAGSTFHTGDPGAGSDSWPCVFQRLLGILDEQASWKEAGDCAAWLLFRQHAGTTGMRADVTDGSPASCPALFSRKKASQENKTNHREVIPGLGLERGASQ